MGAHGVDEESSQRAKRYRGQALEIRTVAEDVKHPESRVALFRLADSYERLADKLDQASKPNDATG
jgi:hypothetical protein